MGCGDRAESGFYLPAPGSVTAELAGSICPAQLCLGLFPGEPRQEAGELDSAANVVTFPD